MAWSFFFEFEQPKNAVINNARVQGVNDKLAVFFRENEVGAFEEVEMMGNGGFAQAEMVGNSAGGKVTGAK